MDGEQAEDGRRQRGAHADGQPPAALLGKALVRRVARGAGVVRCIHIAAMRSRRHAAKRLTFFGMICCWYAQRPQRVA